MELQYANTTFPYNSAGSFINFFEGLAYEHVNFIFADALHAQESLYPSMHMSMYKFGLSEPGSVSYYDQSYAPMVNDHSLGVDGYSRHLDSTSTMSDEQTAAVHTDWEENLSTNEHADSEECPQSHHNARDNQVIWQDNVDPDQMTYEELLELGEAVGSQSRGLPQNLISLLPISKFKRSLFSRKKSRNERCVICQMEYKRRDRQMTLPCKHVYHADCGTRWLSINKACPICYTEVFGDGSKR